MWPEGIEECVSDAFQAVLDKADGTPPIVENPDGLDVDIQEDAHEIGPGIGNDKNSEELLDTIDMNHMRTFYIEPAGFQTLEHCFNSPSLFIGEEGILRSAERDENLWLRYSRLILEQCSGKVAEFTADPIDSVKDPLFAMMEIGKDMLRTDLLPASRIFDPEIIPDTDMVLDSIVIEPSEPFFSDKLPVSDKTLDILPPEQANEPVHNVYPFLPVRVPSLGKKPEQNRERHMFIRYAQN